MFAYFSADLFEGRACDVQQGELENDHVNGCNARFDSDLSVVKPGRSGFPGGHVLFWTSKAGWSLRVLAKSGSLTAVLLNVRVLAGPWSGLKSFYLDNWTCVQRNCYRFYYENVSI